MALNEQVKWVKVVCILLWEKVKWEFPKKKKMQESNMPPYVIKEALATILTKKIISFGNW